MTQKEKELLLKDLCARLPYNNTMISVNDGKYRKDVKLHPHYIFDWDAECWDAKPYLRPMSSMTKEEAKEFSVLEVGIHLFKGPLIPSYDTLDWLNEKKFDYRGLIPMGLALEVTEDNNPYK